VGVHRSYERRTAKSWSTTTLGGERCPRIHAKPGRRRSRRNSPLTRDREKKSIEGNNRIADDEYRVTARYKALSPATRRDYERCSAQSAMSSEPSRGPLSSPRQSSDFPNVRDEMKDAPSRRYA